MRSSTVALLALISASTRALVLEPMQQSWEFDLYTEDGQVQAFPVYGARSIPRQKQYLPSICLCSWPYLIPGSRVAPYLPKYTFPFVLDLPDDAEFGYDFEVPFSPGTQMQICMFDANGYTGGCSSVVSIVLSATEPSNTCTNETFSRLQNLDVEANIVKGPLSRTAWVAQTRVVGYSTFAQEWDGPVHGHSAHQRQLHTELQLDGLFVVGNTLLHIGSLKVKDAERNVWSYGLLHSGEGTTSCMANDPGAIVPPGAAAGAGAGAALLGFVIGALGVWIFLVRRHLRRSVPRPRSVNSGSVASSTRTASHTHLETATEAGPPSSDNHARTQSALRPRGETQSSRQDSGRNIYVVHSDGGAAPVRVYYENEEEGVEELLPNYAGDGGPDGPSRSKRKDGQPPRSGTSPLHAREATRKPVGPR
ncbi:hypothetical protein EV715DRAFT_276739 [Schizophyllum commune]